MDAHESAAQTRIDSFKFGGPTTTPAPGHRPSHTRSHSRNFSSPSPLPQSTSNPLFPISQTPSDHSLNRFSFPSSSAPVPAATKRNSHHRRRSSVSTRTESAELMGVSLPELPPSNSEGNVNLGDRDSIRRRALWALEGKPDVSFAKVEIPDITTPTLENPSFDLPAKSTFATGSAGCLGPNLIPMLTSKRDSFKLLATSSSSKDQLHTLVEEEEEEEEPVLQEEDKNQSVLATAEVVELEIESGSSDTFMDQDGESAADDTLPSISTRARPNLRPLSLKPEKVALLHELPTPASTPSPRSGLRRLSLSPSNSSPDDNIQTVTPTPVSRRPQLTLKLSENPPLPNHEDDSRPRRRSSITYKPSSHDVTHSLAGLPTPEMTPTFRDGRFSIPDPTRRNKSEDEFFPGGPSQNRPLSASEQHFLVKSHKALLARITDLEQALINRRRTSSMYTPSNAGSRPSSMLSDITSSDPGSEPNDEMLKLVVDLKAERDELKSDIDGWRTRVGDMEKQMSMLTTRIDVERRDAWVARSQARLLEVGKAAVEQKLEDTEKVLEEIRTECRTLRTEKENLVSDNEEIMAKTHDLEEQLKIALMELKQEREENNRLRDEMLTATAPIISAIVDRPPSSYGRNARTAFSSTDSTESSATEVEMELASDCEAKFSFMLKAVPEEDESNDNSEEDNGLAGYEDEEESDTSFRSSSSFDLSDTQSESTLLSTGLSTPRPRDSLFSIPEPSASEQMMHHDQPPPPPPPPSWMNWTFPRTAHGQVVQHNKQDSVDHFFGCLENESGSDGSLSPHSPAEYSIEQSKSLFCNALKDTQDDDVSPFFMLPPGVGVVVDEKRLDIVFEEEEDAMSDDDTSDGEMFGEMGGIRITLSPPRPEDDGLTNGDELPQLLMQTSVEKAPQLPMFNFGDEDDTGFSFDKALERSQFEEKKREEIVVPTVVISPPEAVMSSSVETPVVPVPAGVQTPPSSIPRSTPPRSISPRSTPPSAIPRFAGSRQSPDNTSSSRSPYVTSPPKREGALPSFIPQPISSPSPTRTSVPTKSQFAGNARFVRQPQRKSMMSNTSGSFEYQETSANAYVPVKRDDRSNRFSDKDPYGHEDGQQTQIMKSVDLTQLRSTFDDEQTSFQRHENMTNQTTASTLTSIMTSPIAAKLTSFMPFSWGAAAVRAAPAATGIASPSSNSSRSSLSFDRQVTGQLSQILRPQRQDRGFVARQHQLEKLKQRMNVQGKQQMSFDVAPHCRKCSSHVVVL
ncbi:hypothetical protein Agabi119p4_4505 [Agaricus bisporus var. burnettii]|uniref:Uncharacterized protein n=1 Tax=Agaricus bisporus var. burnettii TaxID=192524 RepID=A0A8H7F3J5_AGABI|nr:hypothetical protein Agabi119p4_4505 [Agaricus bisporus var. burnettii]